MSLPVTEKQIMTLPSTEKDDEETVSAVQGRAQAKGSTSVGRSQHPASGDTSAPGRTLEATGVRAPHKTSLSKARNLARRCAVQALYQWHVTQQNVGDIDAQFVTEHDVKKVDIAYFQEILHQVPAHVTALDAHYATFLDRPVHELDPVECAILRMSVYELAHRPDIPYRVVINEGVDMAKVFGAEQSHKYINGVLDKVARKLRTAEIQMKARKPGA